MARRYTRDNRGRFASVGATARGGRLRTASGKKRETQTAKIKGGAASGTIGKPKGLKPQSAKKLQTGIAVNRMRSINQKIGKGPDLAQINIKGRFTGQAGKRMDASIDRAVKQTEAAQIAALMKPKAQVRAERAARAEARKVAAAAKPKRTRSAESLRVSRAKQVEKRRGISRNPAAWRQESAGRMAANAKRTQERALAFYKGGGKANGSRPKVKPAAAKQAASKGRTIGHSEAYARRSEAQLRRGIETGRRAQAYLSSQKAYAAPIGSRLSNAWGKAGRVEWGSRNALNSIANKRLNEARKNRKGGFS